MNSRDEILSQAVSKRIYVTLPDTLHEELESWAEYQGRPTANLAAYLIELGVREAKARGEFKTLDTGSK
jgi:metal-responsive CopG/Arc/MetJ family transcriptional regulator